MPPACANQGVSSEAPIGSRKRRFQCGFLPWSGVRPVSVEAFHGFSGRFFRALLSWTKQVSFDKWAVGKCRNEGARMKKFSTSFARKKLFCPFLEGVICFICLPCRCGCFCHCFYLLDVWSDWRCSCGYQKHVLIPWFVVDGHLC